MLDSAPLRSSQQDERQDPTYEPDVEQSPAAFPDSSEDEGDAISLSGAKKRRRLACAGVADEEMLRFGREAAMKALARTQEKEVAQRREEERRGTMSAQRSPRAARQAQDDDCVVIEPISGMQRQAPAVHPLFARGYKPVRSSSLPLSRRPDLYSSDSPAAKQTPLNTAPPKAAARSKAPRGPGSRGGRGAYSTGKSSKKPSRRTVQAHRRDAGVIGFYSGVERFLGKVRCSFGLLGGYTRAHGASTIHAGQGAGMDWGLAAFSAPAASHGCNDMKCDHRN